MKRIFLSILAIILLLSSDVSYVFASEIIPISTIDYNKIPETPEGMYHYLFVCVDNWEADINTPGNTDGMVLITLDTNSKRILFTSFMREMLIERPEGGPGRLTYILKDNTPEDLMKTLSTHFGIKIEKYIIFNMNDIQQIIDSIGGVNLTITDEEAEYLHNYSIRPDSTIPNLDKGGTYLFNGHGSVIYGRIRKVGGTGDAGRTSRIRNILYSLVEQMSKATFEDALGLINFVISNKMDTNLEMADMLETVGYALELIHVTPEGIQMPPDEARTRVFYSGMDTQSVDFDKSRKILHDFLFKNN